MPLDACQLTKDTFERLQIPPRPPEYYRLAAAQSIGSRAPQVTQAGLLRTTRWFPVWDTAFFVKSSGFKLLACSGYPHSLELHGWNVSIVLSIQTDSVGAARALHWRVWGALAMISFRRSRSYFILAVAIATLLMSCGICSAAGRLGATNPKRAPLQKDQAAVGSRSSRSSQAHKISNVEQRLAALGYWTGDADGALAGGSQSALIAFQKAEGLPRTGRLSPAVFDAIEQATPITPRERGYYHVEIDLDRQILFFVNQDGTVSNILPISTGGGEEFTSEGWTREAITPAGRFKVQEKIAGWHRGPLGRIYYPNYILGGLAIHGYPSVPVRPASHGCIRIPMFAARRFSEMTPVGTVVLVYGSKPVRPPTREQRAVANSND